MEKFIVITGCSSAGKSSLRTELARRGFATIKEPGRRIVTEELQTGGKALPWADPRAFLDRAVKMALEDRLAATELKGPVFFDRCLIDAVASMERLTGQNIFQQYRDERYNRTVFLAPPWPEIYVTDYARRHSIDAAIAEYELLLAAFEKLGYETRLLPKVGVEERANFVLESLELIG